MVIAIYLSIGAAGTAWWLDWNGPFTAEERQVVSDLVAARAARKGITKRAVWEELKQQAGVRRLEELRRRDWEWVVEQLGV